MTTLLKPSVIAKRKAEDSSPAARRLPSEDCAVLRDLSPQERGEVGVAAISLSNTDKPASNTSPRSCGARSPQTGF
jgi:hypothetical protein